MLISCLRRCCLFSSKAPRNALSSSTHGVLLDRRKIKQEIKEKAKGEVPMESNYKRYQDSVVSMNFYMRHDEWQSQYMYLLMNYNQLGFRRVSDLAFLDRASYFLDLRKKRESERWPSLKINIALDPTIVLTGTDSIVQFMRTN